MVLKLLVNWNRQICEKNTSTLSWYYKQSWWLGSHEMGFSRDATPGPIRV